jgi:hypothetical protein
MRIGDCGNTRAHHVKWGRGSYTLHVRRCASALERERPCSLPLLLFALDLYIGFLSFSLLLDSTAKRKATNKKKRRGVGGALRRINPYSSQRWDGSAAKLRKCCSALQNLLAYDTEGDSLAQLRRHLHASTVLQKLLIGRRVRLLLTILGSIFLISTSLPLCRCPLRDRPLPSSPSLKGGGHKKAGEVGYRSQYLPHAKRSLYHLSYIPTHPRRQLAHMHNVKLCSTKSAQTEGFEPSREITPA